MKKLTVFVLIALACVFLLSGCGGGGMNLTDYTDVLFRGADGEGTARGDFDLLGFEKAVLAEGIDPGTLIKIESTVHVTVTPDSGLKNGDKVTASVTFSEDAAKEAGLKIKGGSKTFTVEGLGQNGMSLGSASGSASEGTDGPTLTELDAFDPAYWNTEDGIRIAYSDISPYGVLSAVNRLPADNPLSKVRYAFSEYKNLHEGDRVTVTASFADRKMESEYVLKAESAEYTVGPVDHFLTDAAELDSGTVSALKQKAESLAGEGVSGILEFRSGNDWTGFYNGETVTVNSLRAADTAYAFRNGDGVIQALVIPCFLNVTVTQPDWMENAGSFTYDLEFFATAEQILIHADRTVSVGYQALIQKGTTDTESILLSDISTWYDGAAAESVRFAG